MRTTEFDYDLPPGLIAQRPAEQRDQSRLLVVERRTMELAHRQFLDFPEFVAPGDILVLNNSKVIPARLRGLNPVTGGKFEILLIEENSANDWWAMLKPGKRARIGSRIQLTGTPGRTDPIHAIVLDVNEEGHRRLRFEGVADILEWLGLLGEVPLPPYVHREGAELRGFDLERYQTLYAGPPGSVAAPTAGLHFTQALLDQLTKKGVKV
jgi:S-adenosylmethionine:tRNA ribosyltransferase-isomerase